MRISMFLNHVILTGLPSREQFGWYYSFIKSAGTFDFVQNGEKLAKHKGWRNDSINFMSKVFSELGFVTIIGWVYIHC